MNEQDDFDNDDQAIQEEEKPANQNFERVVSILFVVVVYLVIFLKILILS